MDYNKLRVDLEYRGRCAEFICKCCVKLIRVLECPQLLVCAGDLGTNIVWLLRSTYTVIMTRHLVDINY